MNAPTQQNAKHISSMVRKRILDKLDNKRLSSYEMSLLITEIGVIVAEMQEMYVLMLGAQRKEFDAKIGELAAGIDKVLNELSSPTINLNVQVPEKQTAQPTDELAEILMRALRGQL